jgi:hypothetical protein
MGWDGMGWDGMGWDGMGWDGIGWDRIGYPTCTSSAFAPMCKSNSSVIGTN